MTGLKVIELATTVGGVAAGEGVTAGGVEPALDGEGRGGAAGEIAGAPVPGGEIDPGAPGGGSPFNGLY